MSKIIRIDVNNHVDILEWKHDYDYLCSLISSECCIYEIVYSKRLEIGNTRYVMLVDEEGKLKPHHQNLLGSFLYGQDLHGGYIAGNMLIVKLNITEDGYDICGIDNYHNVIEEINKNLLKFI